MSSGRRLESFRLTPDVVLSPVLLKTGHWSAQMEGESQAHFPQNGGIFPK